MIRLLSILCLGLVVSFAVMLGGFALGRAGRSSRARGRGSSVLSVGHHTQTKHGSQHENSFVHIDFSFELIVQVFGSTPRTPIRRDRRLSSNLTQLNPRNGPKFQNSVKIFWRRDSQKGTGRQYSWETKRKSCSLWMVKSVRLGSGTRLRGGPESVR